MFESAPPEEHEWTSPRQAPPIKQPEYSNGEFAAVTIGAILLAIGILTAFVPGNPAGAGSAIVGVLMMIGGKGLCYLRSIWTLLDDRPE